MFLKIALGGMDSIGLSQDRDTGMNLPVLYNAGELLSGCTTGGLTSNGQLHGVS
jgi:hypothetical protein